MVQRVLLQLVVSLVLSGAVPVTTEHYDPSRSGSNNNEVILNTSNVNSKTFGKIFSRIVDGRIFAQPLYVPSVAIPGKGARNVVYVCTAHNSVYAYDADDPSATTPLWQVNLGPPVPTATSEVGISSTPAIDLPSRTLYVIAATYQSGVITFHLHALDLASGTSRSNSPALIQGQVAGRGTDSHDGIVTFRAFYQMQRAALLLSNDQVYIGFGSHEDEPVFHGWVFAYNVATLQQSSIFCTSPDADSAGVSDAGGGLIADNQGNLYFKTGHGILDADTGGSDYGDSVVKLSSNLTVLDHFSLSHRDPGTGGVALLAGISPAVTSSPAPAALAISSNGSQPGTEILWGWYSENPFSNDATRRGILRAFNGSNVSQELWNSDQNISRDSAGAWAPFSPPTVANGKVYLATFSNVLDVFGLLADPSSSGMLTGIGDNNSYVANLDAEGTVDWVQWTDGELKRKAGVTAQVGDNGMIAGGYSFTAPADTTVRKLVVHVGGSSSGGTLTAHLSDGSAPDYTDGNAPAIGQYDRNYTLVYRAGSAGQILNVDWRKTSGTGTVTANAIALSAAPGEPVTVRFAAAGALAGTASNVGPSSGTTPQSATIDAPFPTLLQATVTDSGGAPASGVTVTFTAPGAPTVVNASYFAMALNDPDVGFGHDEGNAGHSFVTTVGAGLGPNGLPVLNSTGLSLLHDVNPGTNELQWWSTLSPYVSALNNSFYQPAVSLPFCDNHMYTNAAPGQTGDDSTAFLTAKFVGNFSLTSPGNLSFNFCSNDDGLLYLSGGVFGANGTLVIDNGGIHDVLCTAANVNTNLLTNVAPGNYTVTVFYDDRQQVGAELDVSITSPTTAQGSFAGATIATALTNTSGVAMAPVFTANGQPGSYFVTGSVAGMPAPANFSLTNSLGSPTGSLSGFGDSSASGVNLTTEGAADWVHWGDGSLTRKSGVAPQLSTYTVVGNGGLLTYSDDPRPLSWTDGTPTATSTTNHNGVYISGLGQGFSFSAPADTSARTLIVHVGGWKSGGTLTAHLSDGSAADFVDVTQIVNGQFDRNYTLTYSAGSANQTLIVTWVMNACGPGNVTLSAAALVGVAPTPASIQPSAGTPQSTAISTTFATTLQAKVTDGGGNLLSGLSVTFSSPSSGPSATFAGNTTIAMTNTNGVATSSALTANNVAGSYLVTASVAGVASSASFNLTNTSVAGSGSLVGSGSSSAALVNLTTEGSADWEHWGDTSLNRKSSVAAQLTNYVTVGTGTVIPYANDPRPVNWSDGVPTLTGAGNPNGLYISGLNQGFSFTAPADSTVRSLAVHVGGWFSGGTLTAHLSDASALDFVDVTTAATGQYDRNYTITYHAGAAGQSLIVTWVMTSGTGNVTLSAAALAAASAANSIVASGGTPQGTPEGTVFGTALKATVTDSGGKPVSGTTVTFTAPSSGASGTFGGSATANVVTSVNGVATAPTFTANIQTGSYTVTAAVAGAATPADFSLTNTAPVGGGLLQGAGTSATTAVDLTAEGTADWIHWGDNNLNRKAAVTAQLTTFTVVGSGSLNTYNNDLRHISWTDGEPTASSTNNGDGSYIQNAGQGYSFKAPADTSPRTIIVHVGGYSSGGTLTAHLSDQSAGDYVDVTTGASGQYDRNYTINYSTAAAGQTLTVTWVMSSGTGNVTLSAAALQAASGTITATAGTPQSTAESTAFATALQATVKDSGGNPVNGATVAFTAPASGASGTFGGATTVNVVTNASGVATAPALTANSQVGSYTVTAAVAGVTNPANFSLTNTTGSAASIVASAGTPQSAGVSTAFATALQVTVRDNGSNPVSGATVTFTAPASGTTGMFSGSATVDVVTNASGVASAPALTANGQAGSYTVTATVAGLANVANFSLTNTAIAGVGSLQGIGASAATPVNLTTEGITDWVHWGDANLTRKAGVTAQLSSYTVVGTGSIHAYNNDPRSISWTDGKPTSSSTNNRNGLYINGTGQGFSFTAPADTIVRTLIVHAGGYNSGGKLTAHLSDGSAPDFTDVTVVANGQFDRTYTLTYQANAAGQTLTVTWKMNFGGGNVVLDAAALH